MRCPLNSDWSCREGIFLSFFCAMSLMYNFMYNFTKLKDATQEAKTNLTQITGEFSYLQARIEHFSSTKLVSAAQQRKTTTQRQNGNTTATIKAAPNFIAVVCGSGFQVKIIPLFALRLLQVLFSLCGSARGNLTKTCVACHRHKYLIEATPPLVSPRNDD